MIGVRFGSFPTDTHLYYMYIYNSCLMASVVKPFVIEEINLLCGAVG
ncbi:MAG: hypothetical protein QM426_05875 [Euryarchaeota archaeon]|nr:hypothetical protein [Euryarchaeota archaeon]